MDIPPPIQQFSSIKKQSVMQISFNKRTAGHVLEGHVSVLGLLAEVANRLLHVLKWCGTESNRQNMQ